MHETLRPSSHTGSWICVFSAHSEEGASGRVLQAEARRKPHDQRTNVTGLHIMHEERHRDRFNVQLAMLQRRPRTDLIQAALAEQRSFRFCGCDKPLDQLRLFIQTIKHPKESCSSDSGA